jgi:hypothetical protein
LTKKIRVSEFHRSVLRALWDAEGPELLAERTGVNRFALSVAIEGIAVREVDANKLLTFLVSNEPQCHGPAAK